MARRNCRPGRGLNRAQAEATAAALITQGRQVAANTGRPPSPLATEKCSAREEDMPMNRYTFPISAPAESPACACPEAIQERILETLCYQNQLLVDILGAINALTAALLSTQCRR